MKVDRWWAEQLLIRMGHPTAELWPDRGLSQVLALALEPNWDSDLYAWSTRQLLADNLNRMVPGAGKFASSLDQLFKAVCRANRAREEIVVVPDSVDDWMSGHERRVIA